MIKIELFQPLCVVKGVYFAMMGVPSLICAHRFDDESEDDLSCAL